ncbi:MAG: hypothetical protein M1833_004966 [Piccolia ochrophora]|nr:MAG: hypothetical protein M1833_004966 [Piccolia ochrophora]
MTGRYIPPALRNRTSSSLPEHSSSDGHNLSDICRHFGIYEGQHSTLNGSAAASSSLTFILMFHNQHPDAPSFIFCKSNLDLLPPPPKADNLPEKPQSPAKIVPDPPISVPVFVEKNRTTFSFAGYRKLSSITYLYPRSQELITMLEKKFTKTVGGGLGPDGVHKEVRTLAKARSSQQWAQSLSKTWAVIELQVDGARKDEELRIAKAEPMSVTEKLERMRMTGETLRRRGSSTPGGGVMLPSASKPEIGSNASDTSRDIIGTSKEQSAGKTSFPEDRESSQTDEYTSTS